MLLGPERMYLVFDTETTGLDVKTVDVVSLGMVLLDADLNTADEIELLYKPRGPIPIEASKVHGIRDEDVADRRHITEDSAFIAEMFGMADRLIAHNFQYDWAILSRLVPELDGYRAKALCTKDGTTNLCRLPGKFPGKFKWPTLDELAKFLGVENRRDETGLHGALVDCQLLADCVRALAKSYPGYITL